MRRWRTHSPDGVASAMIDVVPASDYDALTAALAERDAHYNELLAEYDSAVAIIRKILPLAPITDSDLEWAQSELAKLESRSLLTKDQP